MPALDLDFSGQGNSLAAQQDPSVQAMRAQQAQLDEQQRQASQRAQLAPLELQQHQQAVAEGQRKQLSETMMGDIAASVMHPDLAGKDFATVAKEQPDYVRSFFPRYGASISELPAAWNKAQSDATGTVVGAPNIPNAVESTKVGNVEVSMHPPSKALDLVLAKAGVKDIPPDASDEDKRALLSQAIQERSAAREEAAATSTAQKENAQNKRIILRTQNAFQTNQTVRNYNNGAANYDSIQKNLAKPNRTGADDVALIQAAATMEAPGRSPTTHDFQVFAQTNGLGGNLAVLQGKVEALFNGDQSYKRGRILDDQTALAIADAAKRAVDSRKETVVPIMSGYIQDIEDAGKDPKKYLPADLVDYVKQVEAGANQAPGPTGAPGGPTQVNSKEEWAALPPGTRYIDSKGKTGTKK